VSEICAGIVSWLGASGNSIPGVSTEFHCFGRNFDFDGEVMLKM
jgi:hypothetical protein